MFGRFMECMLAVISYEKYIDFYYQPVMHRGLKTTNVFLKN